MRFWVVVAVIAVWQVAGTGCGRSLSKSVESELLRAQEAFDHAQTPADFLRAAGIYEQLLQTGFRSGAVFYNQGNAYMRSGQKGRAIACYRQAQRYRPGDPMLDANLRSARENLPTVPASRPLIEYVLFWQDWISYSGKFRLSLLLAVLTLAAALARLFVPHVNLRRLTLVGLVVTGAAIASAWYDWYRFEVQQHGVVLRNDVVARKGDAESYEPAFTATLAEGTECRVLEHRRGWTRIQLPGAQEGWVRLNDIAVY